MNPKVALVFAVASSALLAGCGGGSSSGGGAPSGSTWTIQEARQAYRQMTRPAAKDEETWDALEDVSGLSKLQPVCMSLSSDASGLATETSAGRWPQSAQSSASKWLQDVKNAKASADKCSADSSLAAVKSDGVQALRDLQSSNWASLLGQLGLSAGNNL